MRVVTRRDSKYYQINLERGKGQRCLRRRTTIHHSTSNAEQDAENKRLADIAYHKAMTDLARGDLDLPTEAGPSSSQPSRPILMTRIATGAPSNSATYYAPRWKV